MSGWWHQALCADECDLYDQANAGVKVAIVQAKALCARCPVATFCGAEALGRREPVGTWAGLDPDGRIAELKQRIVVRISAPSAMEIYSPTVALVDRIDDALADGTPLIHVIRGTVADGPHGGYASWRRRFDTRLSGANSDAVSTRMKAS